MTWKHDSGFSVTPFLGPHSITWNVPSFISNHAKEEVHSIISPNSLWWLLLFKFLMKAKRPHLIGKSHIEDDICDNWVYTVCQVSHIIPWNPPSKPKSKDHCPQLRRGSWGTDEFTNLPAVSQLWSFCCHSLWHRLPGPGPAKTLGRPL